MLKSILMEHLSLNPDITPDVLKALTKLRKISLDNPPLLSVIDAQIIEILMHRKTE